MESDPRVRSFTIAATKTWEQIEDKRIFGGDILDEASGCPMSAMYWHLAAGEQSEVPIPSDELWIVNRGHVSIRSGHDIASAQAGEVLVVPRGTRGDATAHAETELLTVAYPPSWEIHEADWAAIPDRDDVPNGAATRRLAIDESLPWGQVGDSTVLVANLARLEGTEIDARIARLAAGSALDSAELPRSHDEFAVLLEGAVVIPTPDRALTISQAEFAYLPAATDSVLTASEEALVLFVGHSEHSSSIDP